MIKIHGSSGIEFPNNYSIKSDSGDLTVMNDVNKLWGMNSTGYESKPKLPLFKVRKSSAITSTGDVIFDTVIFNQENFYDNTTGRATAPISGYYFLMVKINHHNRIDIRIQVNDSGGLETGYGYNEIGQYNTSNLGSWNSAYLITEAYMNVGDYANIYISNLYQNTDPDMWTHFSGYLLG